MSLLIPNNSDTGGNIEERWTMMEISKSATQKELVEIYGKSLESLSERTKEIDGKILVEEKRFNDLKKEIDKAAKENNRIGTLVYVGFLALLFVVIGVVAGYWIYVFDSTRKDDYKYGFSEKMNSQNQEIINLQNGNKKLLEIVDCQKFKKYWQYEECFKK